MPVDMFETRTMLQALEEMKPPRTFLLDSFFPNVQTFGTEAVDVDIMKGKRKLAPFVSPLHEGKVLKREGYTTESFKPPYVKPKRTTRAQNFLQRMPGEAVYTGSMTPDQRAAAELGKDLAELRESIIRREEWMAAQALTTGQVVVSGEGVEAVVDFQFDPAQTVTLAGANLWTDASSDPIKDLRTWKRERAQASGATVDRAIIGSNVVDPLYARIQNKLDLRRIDLGEIRPEQLADGVTYLGYLRDPGIDLFTYDEWYLDANDVEQPMVPVDGVILGSTRAQTVRAYGAIQDVEAAQAGLFEAQYFPKSWLQQDPSARFVMVQSAPLVIPTQVGAFMAATVI